MTKKKQKRKKKTKKKNVSLKENWLFLVVLFFSFIALLYIVKVNLLPFKYLLPIILIVGILNLLVKRLWQRKNKKIKIVGVILAIFIVIVSCTITHYAKKTDDFITGKFTEVETISVDYVLVTSAQNEIQEIKEIPKGETIYYFRYSKKIELAKKVLGKYTFLETDSISKTLNQMDVVPSTYLLISKGDFDYLMESTILYDRNNYKIVKSYAVKYQQEKNTEVKDSYTIYLNGTDFTGIMRDFNLIITINTKSKIILLTPILRGYYIDVPAYQMKDTLMCLGSLDSKVSKEAIEELLDTKIDYTVNVNTNSLIEVVDTLGGVEFCSDYSFTTTHILTSDTYQDKNGQKLYVNKGCREYNGLEILAIARERVNLKNNERGRIDNCRKILLSIVKKSMSTTSILNFQEVLDSYSGLYTTDMNKTAITNLAKSFIGNYNDYDILTQTLDGTDGTAMGHLGTQEVGVTFPDEEQVKRARINIKAVLEGQKAGE